MSVPISEITQEQKELVVSFMEKLDALKQERKEGVATISFEELKSMLSSVEASFMEDILKIKPQNYGVSLEFLGYHSVPEDLIAIKEQSYIWEGKQKHIAPQYLPKDTYEAFLEMNKALKKDLTSATGAGSDPAPVGLLIKSAYRSPAYQFLTFLYWLKKYNFDITKTLAQSTLPGYSEHGYIPKQAIDFMTQGGVIWGDKICFDDTEEYKWLLKNANKFGFYLSYPEGNTQGIRFEPWHWHHEKN